MAPKSMPAMGSDGSTATSYHFGKDEWLDSVDGLSEMEFWFKTGTDQTQPAAPEKWVRKWCPHSKTWHQELQQTEAEREFSEAYQAATIAAAEEAAKDKQYKKHVTKEIAWYRKEMSRLEKIAAKEADEERKAANLKKQQQRERQKQKNPKHVQNTHRKWNNKKRGKTEETLEAWQEAWQQLEEAE